MATYNPYAFQSYEVKASAVKQSFSMKQSNLIQTMEDPDLHINLSNRARIGSQAANQKSGKQLYKWLFCFMIIIMFVTSFYLIRAAAVSTSVNEASAEEQSIIVSSGDTLWSIATVHYEHIRDKSYAVYLIKERNGLSSDVIRPGEQLILPQE